MALALGVLASGSGSNLQAVLDAAASKRLDARVAVVVSEDGPVTVFLRGRALSESHPGTQNGG